MPVLAYKRTDTSRSVIYQDELLAPILSQYEGVKVFVDDERDLMLRPTTRSDQTIICVASLALLGNTPEDMQEFLKCCESRKIKLRCAEEDLTWTGKEPIKQMVDEWRDARKNGAVMRGVIKSAQTRKASTASKLALIEDDLKRDKHTTRELLDRVGVKSINSIRNHFGVTREVMQGRYRATQKRRERYEQRTN